jgi:hypothetical protein
MPAEIVIVHRLPVIHRAGYDGPNVVHYMQSHDSARSFLDFGTDLVVVEGDYFYINGLAKDAKRHKAAVLQYSSGLVREPGDYLDGCVPRDEKGCDTILNDLINERDLRRMLRRLDPDELKTRFPAVEWYNINFHKNWFDGSGG